VEKPGFKACLSNATFCRRYDEACLESLVAGGPRGGGGGGDDEDATTANGNVTCGNTSNGKATRVAVVNEKAPAVTAGQSLSPKAAAASADLADAERPSFACSSGKAEVYSIALVGCCTLNEVDP
jgi:hypothetical protein